MAYDPDRDDPYLTSRTDSPREIGRNERLETGPQPDPELVEGPASPLRVAIYAIAILAVLGAVFFGLNAANNSSQTASNPASPPANVAQGAPTTPAAPGGPVRNVTPGMTTGTAPSAPPPAGNSTAK